MLAAAALVAVAVAVPEAQARRKRKGKPAPAAASEREPNEAAAPLYAMGKRAYREKRWDDAIAAFEEAWEADPLPKFPVCPT